MKELYTLKDKLCEELKDYSKQQISEKNIQIIDTIAHTVKNLDKIIEKCEMEEYSNSMGGSYRGGSYRGGSYRGGSYDNGSYRDGSYGNGGLFGNNYDGSYESGYSREGASYRGRSRDSMGRYSGHNSDTVHKLKEMMNQAQDERTRHELKNLIERMEQM